MSLALATRPATRGRKPTDHAGKVYRDLKGVAPTGARTPGGALIWRFGCIHCDAVMEADAAAVRAGRIRCSCRHDLTGQRIGSVTVLAPAPGDAAAYRVRCACGRPGAEFVIGRHRLTPAAAAAVHPCCRRCHLDALEHADLRAMDTGNLEPLERIVRPEGGGSLWRVRCHAGGAGCRGEFDMPARNILAGSRSCGCAARGADLTGQCFGRLTVIEPIARDSGGGRWWRCSCSCADRTVVEVRAGNLLRKQNATRSCGCIKSERGRAWAVEINRDRASPSTVHSPHA